MDLSKKIYCLSQWGRAIMDWAASDPPEFKEAEKRNPWFSTEFIQESIYGIGHQFLILQNLEKWVNQYPTFKASNLNIGIIAAGNIPLVGFHDLLSVLISGNKAILKLSHQDNVLLPALLNLLFKIDPAFHALISIVYSLPYTDAIIATGSDNSSRYFLEKYKSIPHIIRKNRSSCAILDGKESVKDLHLMAKDMFLYYGLGCRNISKLLVPIGYNFNELINACQDYYRLLENQKYSNNYLYQKSIRAINKSQFVDGKFFILEKSSSIVSPLSCIYWDSYSTNEELEYILANQKEKTQCIVSRTHFSGTVRPGQAQYPELTDYADDTDTISFLLNL